MSRRILIVEDEIIVADDLEWQVRQLGFEVIGMATSGEEAVSLADRERPDVVLMDIQLQGVMTGSQAAWLIQHKTGAAIIFVTAFAPTCCRDTGEMPAPGICLSKPFSIFQLKAALQSAVQPC